MKDRSLRQLRQKLEGFLQYPVCAPSGRQKFASQERGLLVDRSQLLNTARSNVAVLSRGNLGVPVFEPDVLRFIYWLLGLSLLCAALGLFSRVSMALSFVTALYTFALQQNFAKYTGGGIDIVVVVMGGFALSRAGEALSLDRFFRLLRRERGNVRKPFVAFATPVAPTLHHGLSMRQRRTM